MAQRYFVARQVEAEQDPISAMTRRGVPAAIATEVIESARNRESWPDIYVPLLDGPGLTAMVIAAQDGCLFSYWAQVGEGFVFPTEAEARRVLEELGESDGVFRVFGFEEAGFSVAPIGSMGTSTKH